MRDDDERSTEQLLEVLESGLAASGEHASLQKMERVANAAINRHCIGASQELKRAALKLVSELPRVARVLPPEAPLRSPLLCRLLDTAWKALQACCLALAPHQPLSGPEIQAVVEAWQALMRCGSAMLGMLCRLADSSQQVAAWRADSAAQQLLAHYCLATGVLPAGHDAAPYLSSADTLRTLLPWLRAVTGTLLQHAGEPRQGGWPAALLHHASAVGSALTCCSARGVWLAADLSAAVTDLLLRHTLPALARPDCPPLEKELLLDLLSTALAGSAAPLSADVEAWVAASGGEAALQHAAAIVVAVPVQRPAGMSATEHLELCSRSTALLAGLATALELACTSGSGSRQVCHAGACSSDGEAAGASVGSSEGGAVDLGSSSGSSSSSSAAPADAAEGTSEAEAATASSSQAAKAEGFRSRHAPACASCSSSSSEGQAAAASAGSSCTAGQQGAARAVVALVAHMAALLSSLAPACADNPCAARHFASTCASMAACVEAVAWLHSFPATPGQLQAWLEAADAGVRLQPLLHQLQPRLAALRALPLGERHAVAVLSRALLHSLLGKPPSLAGGGTDAQAARAGLHRHQWKLHSSLCHLTHWLAADSGRCLAAWPAPMQSASWQWLQHWLCRSYLVAGHAPAGAAQQPPLSGAAVDAAVAAAHWQAVDAAAVAIAGSQWGSVQPPPAHHLAVRLAASAAVVVAACPAACGPRFLSPLLPLSLEEVSKGGVGARRARAAFGQCVSILAAAAAHTPRLSAALASSSLLPRMLAARQWLLALGKEQECSQVERHMLCTLATLRAELGAACKRLQAGSCAAGEARNDVQNMQGKSNGAAEPVRPTVAQQLLAEAEWVQAEWQRIGGSDADAHSGHRLRQQVELGRQAAELLLSFWALPDDRHARACTLGTVAAARSCAHLRCPNVVLQGGPAAKQGAGCHRCSSCRAAWFCSTACSHAAWREGHRHACKGLAAQAARARGGDGAAMRAGALAHAQAGLLAAVGAAG